MTLAFIGDDKIICSPEKLLLHLIFDAFYFGLKWYINNQKYLIEFILYLVNNELCLYLNQDKKNNVVVQTYIDADQKVQFVIQTIHSPDKTPCDQ